MPIVNIDCQIPKDTTNALPLTTIDAITANSTRVFVHDKFDAANTNVYYSEDDGISWTAVNTTLRIGTDFSINDNGYGLLVGGSSPNYSVIVTQDNGNTYSTVSLSNVQNYANPVVSKVNNVGYFRLTNSQTGNDNFMKVSGTSVTTQNSTFSPDNYCVIDINGIETIYGLKTYTLYKSTDSGVTWTQLNASGVTAVDLFSTVINDKVYLFCRDANISSGLYISEDDGESWKHIQNFNAVFNLYMDGYNGILITSNTIYETVDGGYTFRQLSQTPSSNRAGIQ